MNMFARSSDTSKKNHLCTHANGVSGPVIWQTCDVNRDQNSGFISVNVGVELLDVHDGDGSEDGDIEGGCSKG